MRASLLASATASLCRCKRSDAVLSHAPKLNRDQVCGRIRRTLAAWTSNMRKYPAALGNTAEDRASTGAVLSRHQAEPGAKVAPAVKRLSGADHHDKGGRDQRSDPRRAMAIATRGPAAPWRCPRSMLPAFRRRI